MNTEKISHLFWNVRSICRTAADSRINLDIRYREECVACSILKIQL